MRCFLIGSKELSVKVLEELVRQKHTVLGVLTRDDEEGMKTWLEELGHRSLKRRAGEAGITTYEKTSINSAWMIETLADMNLDILLSVFWGEIVRETVLNIPKLGCFNLHTAYLPYNKGSFPMAWAIINGQEYAGLTIHKMLPGVDDGPIVSQKKVPIDKNETGKSLYEKVTNAGFQLFKETLPRFADMTYKLKPQKLDEGSYHSRGYPHAGQTNPYWDTAKKARFKRALYFPPFRGYFSEPPKLLGDYTEPNVRVMLGFDCDRPRGAFIASKQGSEMAERKIAAIEKISRSLEELRIPRTFFICGQFIESMNYKFGAQYLRSAFNTESPLVEIADHSYSHNVLKRLDSRPDKSPISSKQAIEEYRKNTSLFKDILDMDIPNRGYRAPLGHYEGLRGEYILLDRMLRNGIKYISSDLRDEGNLLAPKLERQGGIPRQPYRYENGLLEIPSMGWQDTAFSGTSRTPTVEPVPKSYDEIIDYYRRLFNSARDISFRNERDYFLGLVMHPLDNSYYDPDGKFIYDLNEIVDDLGGSFCTCNDVLNHYNSSIENNGT